MINYGGDGEKGVWYDGKKKNKEEKIRGRVNISNSAKAFLGLGKRGKRKAI